MTFSYLRNFNVVLAKLISYFSFKIALFIGIGLLLKVENRIHKHCKWIITLHLHPSLKWMHGKSYCCTTSSWVNGVGEGIFLSHWKKFICSYIPQKLLPLSFNKEYIKILFLDLYNPTKFDHFYTREFRLIINVYDLIFSFISSESVLY